MLLYFLICVFEAKGCFKLAQILLFTFYVSIWLLCSYGENMSVYTCIWKYKIALHKYIGEFGFKYSFCIWLWSPVFYWFSSPSLIPNRTNFSHCPVQTGSRDCVRVIAAQQIDLPEDSNNRGTRTKRTPAVSHVGGVGPLTDGRKPGLVCSAGGLKPVRDRSGTRARAGDLCGRVDNPVERGGLKHLREGTGVGGAEGRRNSRVERRTGWWWWGLYGRL